MNDTTGPTNDLADFIRRWESSGAAERANYALFLTQLCDCLDVPQPDPTTDDLEKNAYVFERDVTFDQGDGTTTTGRIDLYKRGCFVLEAKQGSDKVIELHNEFTLRGKTYVPFPDPQSFRIKLFDLAGPESLCGSQRSGPITASKISFVLAQIRRSDLRIDPDATNSMECHFHAHSLTLLRSIQSLACHITCVQTTSNLPCRMFTISSLM